MIIPYIWKNKSHVPNRQPVNVGSNLPNNITPPLWMGKAPTDPTRKKNRLAPSLCVDPGTDLWSKHGKSQGLNQAKRGSDRYMCIQ